MSWGFLHFRLKKYHTKLHLQIRQKKWISFHSKLLRQLFNTPISESNWLPQLWKSFDFLGHGLYSITTRERYQDLSIHIRSLVLKSLCERAFDGDLLTNFMKLQPDQHLWRMQPLGVDSKLSQYWYFGTCNEPLPVIYHEISLPAKPSGKSSRNLQLSKETTKPFKILEVACVSREEMEALVVRLSKEKKNRPLCDSIRNIIGEIDKKIQKKINSEKAAKRNGLDTSNIIEISERRSRKRINYAELDSGDLDGADEINHEATTRLQYEEQGRPKRSTVGISGTLGSEYDFE